MALARPALLFTGVVLLVTAYLDTGLQSVRPLAGILARLRWLFIAILLVYGWWTPGADLLPELGPLSPTVQGLQLGLLRVLALTSIVGAVHLLLQTTRREQLISALMLVARPFGRDNGERFAVRVVLVMETVSQVQPMVKAAIGRPRPGTGALSRLGHYARMIYEEVLERVQLTEPKTIDIPDPVAPPFHQWLIPSVLGLAFWVIS